MMQVVVAYWCSVMASVMRFMLLWCDVFGSVAVIVLADVSE
jgi:hypothetical protein